MLNKFHVLFYYTHLRLNKWLTKKFNSTKAHRIITNMKRKLRHDTRNKIHNRILMLINFMAQKHDTEIYKIHYFIL